MFENYYVKKIKHSSRGGRFPLKTNGRAQRKDFFFRKNQTLMRARTQKS
jgi:hypothetical protein